MTEPVYCEDSADEVVFGDDVIDIANEDIEGENV